MKRSLLYVFLIIVCGAYIAYHLVKKTNCFEFEQVNLHLPKTDFLCNDPFFLAENVCFNKDSYVLQISSQLYTISSDFKQIEALPLNECGNLLYNELFVRNDSLIVTSQWEERDSGSNLYFEYYNSKLKKWEKIKEFPMSKASCFLAPNYENDLFEVNYVVKQNDYCLQFKDKHTKRKYLYHVCMNRMLEYNNSFYVIAPHAIYKINVPPQKSSFEEVFQGQDSINIQLDPFVLASNYGEGTIFNSGIIINDEFYIVGEMAGGPAIAQLKNDSLNVVYEFSDKFMFNNLDYSERYRLGVNDCPDKVVLCYYKDDDIGFISIDGKTIKKVSIIME